EAGKMKKQMEYANRRGSPYVVLSGSRELEVRRATLKNMTTGEQSEVPFDELGTLLR
ncbi:MAG: histidine--tRNA ligase, partial [Alistipes sp.]|nr:histidine--tRNA ligase [Alistipes sp.]